MLRRRAGKNEAIGRQNREKLQPLSGVATQLSHGRENIKNSPLCLHPGCATLLQERIHELTKHALDRGTFTDLPQAS